MIGQMTGQVIAKMIDFDKIRAAAFTIGFDDSGSTILGRAINAHPKVIMSCEARVMMQYFNNALPTRQAFFAQILSTDREQHQHRRSYLRSLISRTHGLQTYIHKSHYQQRIALIGDKDSMCNTRALTAEISNLDKIEKFLGCPLKFVFTVRNPYDIVSTVVRKLSASGDYPEFLKKTADEKLEKQISTLAKRAEKNDRLIRLIPADRCFISRHEDAVNQPKQQLADISAFLGIDRIESHLLACEEMYHKTPHKSRASLKWKPKHKERVMRLIERYEFFAGYRWDS